MQRHSRLCPGPRRGGCQASRWCGRRQGARATGASSCGCGARICESAMPPRCHSGSDRPSRSGSGSPSRWPTFPCSRRTASGRSPYSPRHCRRAVSCRAASPRRAGTAASCLSRHPENDAARPTGGTADPRVARYRTLVISLSAVVPTRYSHRMSAAAMIPVRAPPRTSLA